MGDPADMPELEEDIAARCVYRARDLLPTLHLRLGKNPRRVGIPEASRRDRGGFGNQQACSRSLPIVFRIQLSGHIPLRCTAARKWRQEDSVWGLERAELKRSEEGCLHTNDIQAIEL